MNSKTLQLFVLGCCFMPASLSAQELQESYVKWYPYTNSTLSSVVKTWQPGQDLTEDDHFFISRVKPKQRFRNAATQVRSDITAENDKRLIAWVPYNDPKKNALPDGLFDSEVFSMWSYVNHWGNWTAPLGRIPAALLDVAHKNGVAVSSVAGIPFGSMGEYWRGELRNLANLDTDKLAEYMSYYGQDGLGYNSEYNEYGQTTKNLRNMHVKLVKAMEAKNPIFENIWYDGTNDNGIINFDQGLGSHNKLNFGDKDNKCYSLFFNYNWPSTYLLNKSVSTAETLQRDPLYLYAGINMQGGEPKGTSWSILKNYNISIGLWGAHQMNMFWESRAEKGSADDAKQRTYMLRTERYFTGGSRNPANVPHIIDKMAYNVDNTNFHGMSSFMTAKSTLSWDLATEPFITYFNLGNGKFFNWKGVRQHDRSWANVGVQDYLPTWRWWFSNKILGGQAADVPTNGLDAEFIWDDAYVGGSCMRVFGTSTDEYLHLFKTEYKLQQNDVITVRYKHLSGASDMNLVLTAKGDEKTAINENGFSLLTTTQAIDDENWTERSFTVGSELAGKDLSLVALHFQNANNLNLYLGEFSITRGTTPKPENPIIFDSKLLVYNKAGMDAKIIFAMDNTKPVNEVCYNQDVNVSLFKLWAQQENEAKPILMGVTTSWAGLMYSIPVNTANTSTKMRLGVSAVSLDMKSESDIVWSAYHEPTSYVYDDALTINKTVIKPNEEFTISYADPKHSAANWKILDSNGTEVFSANNVTSITVNNLATIGNYDLEVYGEVHDDKGQVSKVTRKLKGYIPVSDLSKGALPKIETLTVNGQTATVNADVNQAVALAYTGKAASGKLSRGTELKEKGFVFKAADMGLTSNVQEWSMSFWLKFNTLPKGGVQILDVRHQGGTWPQNNWGSIWSQYDVDKKIYSFTIRETRNGGSPEHTQDWDVSFEPGVWSHITITMEKSGSGVREHVYVNGKPAPAKEWRYNGSKGNGFINRYTNSTAWWDQNHFMIGFGRFGLAAIDGVVDDVKFFSKRLSDAEVEANMLSVDKNAANIKAYWDFEADAASDDWFRSVAGDHDLKAARAEMAAGAGEGQGTIRPLPAIYDAGNPFVQGEAFTIVTTPSWKTRKGSVTEVTGNDVAGAAKVSYPAGGDYDITLTLENSLGKDQRTFSVIHVTSTTGINETEATELRAYTVGEDILVECAEAGNYKFDVFTVDGTQVLNNTLAVNAGNTVRLHLANTGIYILKVTKDGKTLRTVKLIRK